MTGSTDLTIGNTKVKFLCVVYWQCHDLIGGRRWHGNGQAHFTTLGLPSCSWIKEKHIKFLSILMDMLAWAMTKVIGLVCVVLTIKSFLRLEWTVASLDLSLFKSVQMHAYVDCQSPIYNLKTILSEASIGVLMFPNNWSLKLGSNLHICGITPGKLPLRDITELTTEDLPRRAETDC